MILDLEGADGKDQLSDEADSVGRLFPIMARVLSVQTKIKYWSILMPPRMSTYKAVSPSWPVYALTSWSSTYHIRQGYNPMAQVFLYSEGFIKVDVSIWMNRLGSV